MAALSSLTAVESQRVISVLEDTVEKLSFLGSITPDVLAHRDELSKFVGDEISRIIAEQRQLEDKYEELVAARGALKGLTNKSKYKRNQAEIQEVSRALRESTKNLCRNLKDNPNIGGNLMKIHTERTALAELLSRTMRELEGGSFATLVTQVEEDKQAQERLADIIRRERETTSAVKQLEDDLARERAEHEREVTQRKATIASLKEELQEIKSRTMVKTKYARKEAKAKMYSTRRQYREAERSLEDRILALDRKREREETVHSETVAFLKRKQEKLVMESARWSEKYATDVEEKEEAFRALNAARERDLARLEELQKRWDEDMARQAAKEAEEQRQRELEELRKKELARQKAAVLVIEAAYLEYRARKAEEAAKKRASKKKRKGKKKKKKSATGATYGWAAELEAEEDPMVARRFHPGFVAARQRSARLMSRRFAERDAVKAKLEADRTRFRRSAAKLRRSHEHRWRKKLRKSPFRVDLLAEQERIDEENRVRLQAESRRARAVERRKERIKNEIILKALAETSDLEALREEKRLIQLEERRLKALLDYERASSHRKNMLYKAQKAEKHRLAEKAAARRKAFRDKVFTRKRLEKEILAEKLMHTSPKSALEF
eukprot:PLAT10746.3.p1 GENE.PLAT10746.3~~PLAT10746.3.p1  ORF type:complete len:613 (+),score=334.17 PLAT10746.3:159-1997(+)